MLGKLLKDEIKSYSFPMGITFLAGLVFTVFMKIICMIPYPNNAGEIIQMLGYNIYYYIVLLIGTVAYIFSIIRFYSTMVADRGYLTWTLPVSSETHIFVKLLGGLLWRALATVVVFALLAVFFLGKYWSDNLMEMFMEVKMAVKEMCQLIEPSFYPAVILYFLGILLWSIVPILFIYLCIAVGQLFGKFRILASVGMYFLSMLVLQVLMILFILVFAVGVEQYAPLFETIFSNMSLPVGMALIAGVIVLFAIGTNILLFVITNNIFKKHLNLE